MIELHSTLPFTSSLFFYYILGSVVVIVLSKHVLSKFLSFSWVLAFLSAFYMLVLFPKPAQLMAMMVYFYSVYYILGRKIKFEGLLLPVILMASPLVLMKFTSIIPPSEEIYSFPNIMALVWQVAGLSYITFKAIQLYIDEKDALETISPLRFFNFMSFVPTILIGPIDRFSRFDADVTRGYKGISISSFVSAMDYFVRGLLYKFIIAESIHQLVLLRLEHNGSILFHLEYMYTYLFYLFFDFAGYSLLAMGFGKMLGIDVPYNFYKPFLSVNPKEFWKRWHKTLGDWLNDYFFKPIFKELTTKKVLKPIQRQNVALFFTFTLMGFWNGFKVHYILSGMLFGIYSVVHNYYVYQCKKQGRDVFFGKLSPVAIQYISIFIFFNAVAFAIYIFSGELIKI